jgi:hypothetical protein
MERFQDKGQYYIFRPGNHDDACYVELAICMPDEEFKEDERFDRVRNAAFLTGNPELVEFLYHRLYNIIEGYPHREIVPGLIGRLKYQFAREFRSWNPHMDAPSNPYDFRKEWHKVRQMVYELELSHPILRTWILTDAEDGEIPADPRVRYKGGHWNMVIGGPHFVEGDLKDWGDGWVGMAKEDWQRELTRKYHKMVVEEQFSYDVEREGSII